MDNRQRDGEKATVWRIKINSQRPDLKGDPANWDAARAYCRQAKVVGVGWGRPDVLRDGAPLEEVLAAVAEIPRWNPTGPRAIGRLANDVQDGDLVWTRDRSGGYFLGLVDGGWHYDDSDEAERWDLNNVRPCTWLDKPLRDYEVPGAVIRNFTGPGETLRKVPSEAAAKVTKMIYERESNPGRPPSPIDPEEIISELLDPIDVEDIVLLFLQADGWLLLPSSRMQDTPLYEAALRNRDGRLAVVAVKSGDHNVVPVRELVNATGDDAQVFVYSTHDAYDAPPEELGAAALTRRQLVDFMGAHPELLPPRISGWIST
jgi:hypothetical protein